MKIICFALKPLIKVKFGHQLLQLFATYGPFGTFETFGTSETFETLRTFGVFETYQTFKTFGMLRIFGTFATACDHLQPFANIRDCLRPVAIISDGL